MTACRYKPALIHNTPSRRTLVFTPEQQPNVRWRLVASITVPSKIIHINIQYINKKPFLAHHARKKAWRVKTDEPTPACSINTHPYNKVHGFFSFVSRNILVSKKIEINWSSHYYFVRITHFPLCLHMYLAESETVKHLTRQLGRSENLPRRCAAENLNSLIAVISNRNNYNF